MKLHNTDAAKPSLEDQIGENLENLWTALSKDNMERLNATASRLAVEHGVRGATDITGFGLVGHALNVARSSEVAIRIDFDRLPTYEAFPALVARGVSTASTRPNKKNAEGRFEENRSLDAAQRELLFDPQTSGGLLLAAPPDEADALLRALVEGGHRAAEIGAVVEGPPRVIVS